MINVIGTEIVIENMKLLKMEFTFNHGHAGLARMMLMASLCLSFSISESSKVTKVFGYKDGADDNTVVRHRRASTVTRIFDHSCDGFDCSQKAYMAVVHYLLFKKRTETDEAFYCKVGNGKECNAVKRMIKDGSGDDMNGNYAKLTHIKIFYKIDLKLHQKSYRSLNYSITLPHEDADGLEATMIMTDLTSETDFYYSTNPLCRVFNFSTSKLTENDLIQPRVINYPCIFGLDESRPQTNYAINIQVLPYQAKLLYYLQIYSEDRKEDMCSVTNGVAVLNLHRKLHVVFESNANAQHYQITLYKDHKFLQNKKLTGSQNQHEFKLEDGGQYYIGIKPMIFGTVCAETRTSPIIWRVEVVPVEDKQQIYVNLVSILLPVAIVVVVLIIGIILLVKQHRRQRRIHIVEESRRRFMENESSSDEATISFDTIKK